MIIAEGKKKKNIAEYILYMWQIEDIIRTSKFDILTIRKQIVEKFEVSDSVKFEIEQWYINLIDKMRHEGIIEKGHLGFLKKIIQDLFDLHLKLISFPDNQYIEYYKSAFANIEVFRTKLQDKKLNDIEVCFYGLYSLLLLRLQKKEVTVETTKAMDTFRNVLAYLSLKYKG